MIEWRHEPYVISTDMEKIDLDVVHGYLTTAYWSQGVSRSIVEQAIRNSVCFGVYRHDEQIGFARVVTDRTTFAWLADVFILPDERGGGLAKWLMEAVMSHPELTGVRRWMLATRDAHGLYRQFGFKEPLRPERYMEIVELDAYSQSQRS